jgi:hypothetical protein
MAFESPVSVLFDTAGTELAVTASFSSSFLDGTAAGILVMGSSSNGAQFLQLADDGAIFITGSVDANFAPNSLVAQGDAGTIAESWFVTLTDGTSVLGADMTAPLYISGAVDILNPVTVNGTVTVDSITNPIVVSSITDPVTIEVTGTLDVNVVNTASITGSVTVNSIVSPVTVRPMACPTTVVTGFGASTTNVTVLATNATRCGATFFMDGNAVAYIKLGATATPTDFTVKLLNNAYFEVPDNYTGQIDVVFDKNDAARVLRITEIAE